MYSEATERGLNRAASEVELWHERNRRNNKMMGG